MRPTSWERSSQSGKSARLHGKGGLSLWSMQPKRQVFVKLTLIRYVLICLPSPATKALLGQREQGGCTSENVRRWSRGGRGGRGSSLPHSLSRKNCPTDWRA